MATPSMSARGTLTRAPPHHPPGRHAPHLRGPRHVAARASAHSMLLPNGLCISHSAPQSEVRFLFSEVYEQQQYLQHGVRLCAGQAVIDVGANIGLFAMFAAEAVGPSGRVIAMEPAPCTAALLRDNLVQHAAWCERAGRQVAPCTALQVAASSSGGHELALTWYPRAPGWSTLVRDEREVLASMHAFLHNLLTATPADAALEAAQAASPEVAGAPAGELSLSRWQQALFSIAARLKRVPGLAWVTDVLVDVHVRQMLGAAEQVQVPVATVSQVITQQQIRRVGLLKVDVERGELDVLRGVSEQHWPLIQQVALEVHDTRGRLADVVALLQAQGFEDVVVDQQPRLRGSALHNVFAVRHRPAAG